MTEPDPTAAIEVFARLLCSVDVHVHGDDHPTWQQMVGEPGQRIRDDYRKAAAWLLPRMTVATKPAVQPPADRAAALADDLRYVLNYRGPGHEHERPGVWDTSGKPCTHCARLATARRNLAAYDREAGEQHAQDEARTTWTPGPVAVAQAGEAARTTTAAYLATACDTCGHTLNWHRNDVGCTVVDCVCSRFREPEDA